MLRFCAEHQIGPDALVKRRQLAVLAHCQGEQISVSDLSVTEQTLPIDQAC